MSSSNDSDIEQLINDDYVRKPKPQREQLSMRDMAKEQPVAPAVQQPKNLDEMLRQIQQKKIDEQQAQQAVEE